MSTPSLLNIPYVIKAGTLYSQIPETGAGDFAVTRVTTPTPNRSTRINADGFIELVNDNVPRLDYPLGGAVNGCPALLVEPSATNSMLYSQSINSWSIKTGLTITDNNAISPDGTQNASYIQQTVGGSAIALQSAGVTVASGQAQSVTFYAKAGEVTSVTLRFVTSSLWAPSGTRPQFTLNLTNGTITLGAGSATVSSQNVGNGWYRYSIVTPATLTSGSTSIQTLTGAILSANSGDGFYLWGVQWEQNSSAPTSYIPTTTAAVTRNADVISDTTATALIGQTEGTIYWEGAISRIDRVLFSLAQGTSTTNCIYLQTLSNGFFRADASVNGSATCAILSLATATLGQFYKIAFAYKENDFALYINGVLQGSDNLGALPTGLSNAIFARGDSSLITDQRCRNIAIYPNRLSNSELATLTTP
jgi:hypothetical protein